MLPFAHISLQDIEGLGLALVESIVVLDGHGDVLLDYLLELVMVLVQPNATSNLPTQKYNTNIRKYRGKLLRAK